MSASSRSLELLRGRKILVTGAAGFLGNHLFRRLVRAGLDVRATVLRPDEARRFAAEGHDVALLDLGGEESWEPVLEGVDVVFAIAGLFQEVEAGAEDYDRVNRLGALRLVETAHRCGVSRFVHCSTAGVHGDVREIPATEETPYNPMDVYQKTKLAGELAVLDFARGAADDRMTLTINRPAMVYGPGDLRMLKLFRAILSRKFLMVGSGRTLAHLGYIADQTDSFLLGATAEAERVHLQAFNIASASPIPLNELAAAIAEAGGVRLRPFRVPVLPVLAAAAACELVCRPFGIRPPLFRRRVGFFTHNRAFDLTKARTRLGYRSTWPHVRGIEETIAWYRAHGLLPAPGRPFDPTRTGEDEERVTAARSA